MNLIDLLTNNLTRTGVSGPDGTKFYNSPADSAKAYAQQEMASVQPGTSEPINVQIPVEAASSFLNSDHPLASALRGESSSQPQQAGPDMQASPSGDQSSGYQEQAPDTSRLPAFLRPNYRQAGMDQFGNPTVTPALTKKGVLLTLLRGGIEGGLAAGGTRTAGEGFQAAEAVPFMRAQRSLAVQRGGLENQLLQKRIYDPMTQAREMAQLNEINARTGYYRAGSQRRDYINTRKGTMLINPDGSPGGIVPGTETDDKPNLQESVQGRQQIIRDMKGQLGANYSLSPQQESEYVLNGRFTGTNTRNPNAYDDIRAIYPDTPQGHAAAATHYLAMSKPDYAGVHEQTKQTDSSNAETIAAGIVNYAGGDPDKALAAFDAALPQVTDQQQKRLAPQIRNAIRARKSVNKPLTPLQKALQEAMGQQ